MYRRLAANELIHWGWLKSDQTCTQANLLAVFPLNTARDKRWWNHCRSLGVSLQGSSKKRQWTCHTHQWFWLQLVESNNCEGGHCIFSICWPWHLLLHCLVWQRWLHSGLEQSCSQLPRPMRLQRPYQALTGLLPTPVKPTSSKVKGRLMQVNDVLTIKRAPIKSVISISKAKATMLKATPATFCTVRHRH